MKITSWFQQFRQHAFRAKRLRRQGRPKTTDQQARSIEHLEDRALLATFTVGNLSDLGPDSLRQAIADANSTAGADVIDLTGVTGTITLTTGIVGISESVTINGPGADQLTISGGNNSGIFAMGGTGQNTYSINAVAIADGNAGALGVGGAINFGDSDDTLIVDAVEFRDNVSNDGGAIHMTGGTATITNSAFIANNTTFVGSALSTTNSHITLRNVTVSGQLAGTTIRNRSTNGEAATLSIENTTIANNTGSTALRTTSGAVTRISNSIFAGNSSDNFTTDGTLTSMGHNISDDASGNLAATGDQINTDPLLAALADNGGSTQTIALLPGSPAIDAGSDLQLPLAVYRFEETINGTIASDLSGNALAATYVNGAGGGQAGPGGVAGAAAKFDGIDDYIDLPDGFADFTNGFSVSAWVFPTGVNSWQRIVDLGNGQASNNIVVSRRAAGNELVIEVFDGITSGGQVTTADPVLELNQWQHIAVSIFDTGEVSVYKNGVAVAISGSPTTAVPNNVVRTSNFIGRSNWSTDAYYEGRYAEVAIFDKALTVAAVNAHFASSVPTFDQRGPGFSRILDGDGDGTAAVDIGAFEADLAPPEAYQVTTLLDELDFSNSDVSLREAILSANHYSGSQQITFDSSFTSNGPQTLLLTQGQLPTITDDVRIEGPNPGLLTIDANDHSRIFQVHDGTALTEINVFITGLTLTGGTALNGGAVQNFENLSLFWMWFQNNSAPGIPPVEQGQAFIPGRGGAIHSDGHATIIQSLFSGNSASDGAAIYSPGTVTILDSTVAGNSGGGASAAEGSGHTIDASGDIISRNNTITGNTGGSAIAASGPLSVANTIVAGNGSGDISGTVNGLSANNILGTTSNDGGLTNGTNGNQVGVDWKTVVENNGTIATLTDNGGLTHTIALLTPGPAIDAGDNASAFGLTRDQRSDPFARIVDGDGDGTATVDVGAFEASLPPQLTVVIAEASISENGGTSTATVSRTGDTTAALTVTLTSDDTTEATVPDTVTIAAGQTTSPAFSIATVDDASVDGTQTVTVTASATGTTSGSDSVDVTDDDIAVTPVLSVNIAAASIAEGGGTAATTGTVTRTGDTTAALTVTLTSDDTTEATVPGTVTIAAGQATSPTFSISAVDDTIVDGTQTVTVTVSATALTSGTDTIDVTDDDTAAGFVVTGPTGFVQNQRPTVSWTAVDGALSYNLYLNIDDGGGNVFQKIAINSSQTSLAIPQDLEFARYRVFVEANMPGDVIQKQDHGHTFVLEVKADLTPVGATTATSPQFTWNRVPGAASYVIFINQPGSPVTATVTDPGSGSTVSHTISAALARNDYKWWVRPVRLVQANTFLGAWSDANEFSTGGRTKITAPVRNSTVDVSIPSFAWNPVPNAQSYEIYVARTGTPGALYRDAGIGNANIRARTLENGDYKVWIRTTLADGSSVWGSGVAFTVNAPTTSLVTTPTGGDAPGFDTTPTFNWPATSGATSYDVYVHRGTQSLLRNVTQTSWTSDTALVEDVWSFQVRPVNASGAGQWSAPISFSTSGQTTLTSPGTTTSDRTPTFTWNPVAGAVNYTLQVDNLTTETSRVIREDGLTATSFTPSSDLAPGSYRAWVRAVSTSGLAGPFSVPVDFVVAATSGQAIDVDDTAAEILIASLSSLEASANDAATAVAGPAAVVDLAMDSRTSEVAKFSMATDESDTDSTEIDAQFADMNTWLGNV